jgi:uncharacterized membrane protein
MSVFPLLVIVHALAATVWTGGHLVLDLGVLPRALRAQSAAQIRAFEETFEPLALTALAIQVLTGLWMGWIYLPGFWGLFSPGNPIGMLVGVKLLMLAATVALAIHARFRLIPNLTDDNLTGLAHPRHHRPGDRLSGGGCLDSAGWAGLTHSPATTKPGALAPGICLLSRGAIPRESGAAVREVCLATAVIVCRSGFLWLWGGAAGAGTWGQVSSGTFRWVRGT